MVSAGAGLWNLIARLPVLTSVTVKRLLVHLSPAYS
jgi:hypothetical protein